MSCRREQNSQLLLMAEKQLQLIFRLVSLGYTGTCCLFCCTAKMDFKCLSSSPHSAECIVFFFQNQTILFVLNLDRVVKDQNLSGFYCCVSISSVEMFFFTSCFKNWKLVDIFYYKGKSHVNSFHWNKYPRWKNSPISCSEYNCRILELTSLLLQYKWSQ